MMKISDQMSDLRSALKAVLALYPEEEDECGVPIRQQHECMLRNVLRSAEQGGPIESELRVAIMQAYSKEIA